MDFHIPTGSIVRAELPELCVLRLVAPDVWIYTHNRFEYTADTFRVEAYIERGMSDKYAADRGGDFLDEALARVKARYRRTHGDAA